MTFNVDLTITGVQEAQAQNLRQIAMLRPQSVFGRVIRDASLDAHRYAVAVTHQDTGTLKAAHRIEVAGVNGRVFIDPSATNPRSLQAAADYGRYEHARGGSHAFYSRVVSEHGAEILRRARLDLKLAIEGA